MLPIVRPVAMLVAKRFGPWAGRVAQRDAGFMSKLLTKLRASGKFVGSNMQDIISYMKNNKMNTFWVLSSIAGLGYSVYDLVKDSDDPDVPKMIPEWERAVAEKSGQALEEGVNLMDSAVTASQVLNFAFDPDRRAQDELLRKALRWAKGHYGSVAAAKEAHSLMQVFSELSPEAVQYGFDNLRLS